MGQWQACQPPPEVRSRDARIMPVASSRAAPWSRRRRPVCALPLNRLRYLLMVIRLCRRITCLLHHMLYVFYQPLRLLRDGGEVDSPAEANAPRRQYLIVCWVPIPLGDFAPLSHMEVVGDARDLPLPGALVGVTGKLLSDGRRTQPGNDPSSEPG